MQKSTLQAAIMFADVAGSSALYKKLGDREANAAISKCVDMMMAEVDSNHGNVIKTIGDEVMARFDSPSNGCLAAVAIQRRSKRELDLSIRIGMDFGTAILEQNDVFGQVVNDAAAVAGIARAKQIVITQNVYDDLPGGAPYSVELFDTIKLKGSPHETHIYRVEWEQKERKVESTKLFNVADIGGPTLVNPDIPSTLELRCKESLVKVTEDDTPFVIGRDAACNLVINSNFASREHLHIVFRRGKFVLVDHSTNGTYVRVEDAGPIYLRREELPLTRSGQISLGKQIEPGDQDLLTFRV